MSAYKQFTTKDIVITPFSANKGFSYKGDAMTASNVEVEIYFGTQPPENKLIFEPTTNSTWASWVSGVSASQNVTGFETKLNTNSVYSSIKQLYYSNYSGSQSGSLVATSSLLYGLEGPQNNTFIDNNNIDIGLSGSNNMPIGALHSPQYNNYLQSTTQQIRPLIMGESQVWLSVSQSNYCTVVSIPSKLWGNNIEPQSFALEFGTGATPQLLAYYYIWDDGDGNLRYRMYNNNILITEDEFCGNIIYNHGIAIFTNVGDSTRGSFDQDELAQFGAQVMQGQDGFVGTTAYLNRTTVGWSSSVTLYEHQYKCVVRENEFGYSLNPSILSGSQSTAPLLGTNYVYKDFATGSYFSPYITTVGLYDNDQNLLAIGKLSVPTKVPMNADLEIQVAFDSI